MRIQAARLEMTETDAKSKAISMLGAVKFNTNRYFWVNIAAPRQIRA